MAEKTTEKAAEKTTDKAADKAAKRLRITQVRSSNGANPSQRETLRTLGLRRIGSTTERPDHPTVLGMIRTVQHLVVVDNQAGKANDG
jgi:large subunit ribosomal protein L30